MKVQLKAKVQGNYVDVYEKFDIKFFEYLLPAFPKSEIIQFTGSKTGDIVELRFKKPLNQRWVSDITDHKIEEDHAYFVDEGSELPWPLKFWKHKHIIRKVDNSTSIIEDDMQYSTNIKLLDLLMWPVVYLAFRPRKSLYRKYFEKHLGE